jgi:hypothetical protein
MRRLILSFALEGAASGVGVAPAAAAMLPEAACNQGTMNAHQRAPHHSSGHQHIPMMMDMDGSGGMDPMCMTMP